MSLNKGDKVKVEYTGTLEDGTVFDASEKHGCPLEFEIGSGQIIPGFENAIISMKEGEEKDILLESKDAYGDPNPELVKKVPRDQIPKDQDPQPGMVMVIGLANGQQIPARVKAVDDKDITIDLNHPLAGKKLNFKLKLVGVTSA